MIMEKVTGRERRWEEERAYFDRQAERNRSSVKPISPLTLHRYLHPRRRFDKEFRLRILKDLKGKTVLDAGCNDGENSVLFARLGAKVTGVDISSKSIELANLRAAVNGLSDSVRLLCSPLETVDLPANSFDVIWCHYILHHVIEDMPLLMDNLTRWAKPGALLVFAEPVSLSRIFRKLRLALPFPANGTPDERPLEEPELKIIRGHLACLRSRRFALLGRFARFILINGNYEHLPFHRRILVDALTSLDYFLLSLPFVKRMAGVMVIYGHPNKQ